MEAAKMLRRTLVVGNWKMNLTTQQSSLLLRRLQQNIQGHRAVEVVLAPSMLALQPLSVEIDRRKFKLAAQNAYFKDEGGFTGEVSFAMLRGIVSYAIIGHSARRLYFGETLDDVTQKVEAAVRNDITPILCVGETKRERDARETKRVICDQVVSALANLTSAEIDSVVIAYEPIWAISAYGGAVAKPSDVTTVVEYIRLQIRELYGKLAAERVRVLYGGSVDAHDVKGFLSIKGIDGVLVGAASISANKFVNIVSAAYQTHTEVQ